MKLTRKDRLQWALKYLKEEKEAEEKRMDALDRIKGLREVIIMREKKAEYMAEVEQMIRNIEDEICQTEETEGKRA